MNQLVLPIIGEVKEAAPDDRPSVRKRRTLSQTYYYLERRVNGEAYFLWKFVRDHPEWIKVADARHRKPKRYKVLKTAQTAATRWKAEVKVWNPQTRAAQP
jgi:hypothetical protein